MKFILPETPTINSPPLQNNPLEQQLKGSIQPFIGKPPQFPIIPNPVAGLKRAINFNADYGGCGYWRMIWPEMLININQLGVINSSTAMLSEQRYYEDAKSVRIQRQALPIQKDFAKYLRLLSEKMDFKLIYEIDDVMFREDIPDYNSCKPAFDTPIIAQNALEIMNMCHEITVTCEYMKQYYMEKTGHKNITIIPNYTPKFWLDRFYSSQKIAERLDQNKKRLRIGYFGSGTHTDARNATGQKDDFTHIIDTVIKTRKEFKWVFVGTLPLLLKQYYHTGDIEYYPWTTLNEYPYLFDKVGVNITIAPLQDNIFNRAKSNIKYLEAGCFGIPCICQDLITYVKAPLKFKTGNELVDVIKKLTNDRQLYMKHSKIARQFAETMWLEDHLDEYVKLYGISKDT